MRAAQAEYRHRLNGRSGYVAFVGAGEVERIDISRNCGLRYSADFGLRYRVAKDYGLDASPDFSVTDSGDQHIYLSVSQYF